MSDNTVLSDREKALEWWRSKGFFFRENLIRRHFEDANSHIKVKTITQEEIEYIWRKETKQYTPLVNEGEAQAKRLVQLENNYLLLNDALEAIVNEWIGEEPYRDVPQYKEFEDKTLGSGGYWSPYGKMIKAELIHNAIEVLKIANPKLP